VSDSLRVDPIACAGHGLCAELFPERIWLDDWGYPVIDGDELTADLLEHARRAVAACPSVALRLERDRATRGAGGAGGARGARGAGEALGAGGAGGKNRPVRASDV
jgi:ferredoxin